MEKEMLEYLNTLKVVRKSFLEDDDSELLEPQIEMLDIIISDIEEIFKGGENEDGISKR